MGLQWSQQGCHSEHILHHKLAMHSLNVSEFWSKTTEKKLKELGGKFSAEQCLHPIKCGHCLGIQAVAVVSATLIQLIAEATLLKLFSMV